MLVDRSADEFASLQKRLGEARTFREICDVLNAQYRAWLRFHAAAEEVNRLARGWTFVAPAPQPA